MLINIKVKTNAKNNKIEKIDDKNYQVYTAELPINSRANLAIISLLSDYFQTKKYNISIVKGISSKNKIINIDI